MLLGFNRQPNSPTTPSPKHRPNSTNSNQSPSTDTPEDKNNRPKKEDHAPRGGKKGHKGKSRPLAPAAEVHAIIDLFPEACEHCWKPLGHISDPKSKCYQVLDIPPMVPEITEYRRHSVRCTCGKKTRAAMHKNITSSPFGSRLCSLIALLTGVHHMSRRSTQTFLCDVFGVKISLGAIANIERRFGKNLQQVSDDVFEYIRRSDVKHLDATGWYESHTPHTLWVMTNKLATVFGIVKNGTSQTLQEWLGNEHHCILVTDRARVFGFWDMHNRQICWAHLLRKFVSFSEQNGICGKIGTRLLEAVHLMFHYWHQRCAKSIKESLFGRCMKKVRMMIEQALQEGAQSGHPVLSGSCKDILFHKEAFWNFLEHPNVEPTNNPAEREVRAFVLWRRRCFGSQSSHGSTYAQHMMTVAHTARKQNKSVFVYLQLCWNAFASDQAAPSLVT